MTVCMQTTAHAMMVALDLYTAIASLAQTVQTAPQGFTLRLLPPLSHRRCLHPRLHLHRHSAMFGDSLLRRRPRGVGIAGSSLLETTRGWVRQVTRPWH